MPRLGAGGFVLLGCALIACLALAAMGRWPVATLFGAAIGTIFYFAQVIELPTVRRKPNSVPIILVLLAAAELARETEWTAGCCELMIKLTVAQIYFSSALTKLRIGGFAWMGGSSLRLTLLRYRLRDGNRAAEWLARRLPACGVAATLVLLFELTFWMMIPFPLLTWIYVPLGVAFHIGTAALMRIHYWIYLFPAYLIFALKPN